MMVPWTVHCPTRFIEDAAAGLAAALSAIVLSIRSGSRVVDAAAGAGQVRGVVGDGAVDHGQGRPAAVEDAAAVLSPSCSRSSRSASVRMPLLSMAPPKRPDPPETVRSWSVTMAPCAHRERGDPCGGSGTAAQDQAGSVRAVDRHVACDRQLRRAE